MKQIKISNIETEIDDKLWGSISQIIQETTGKVPIPSTVSFQIGKKEIIDISAVPCYHS